MEITSEGLWIGLAVTLSIGTVFALAAVSFGRYARSERWEARGWWIGAFCGALLAFPLLALAIVGLAILIFRPEAILGLQLHAVPEGLPGAGRIPIGSFGFLSQSGAGRTTLLLIAEGRSAFDASVWAVLLLMSSTLIVLSFTRALIPQRGSTAAAREGRLWLLRRDWRLDAALLGAAGLAYVGIFTTLLVHIAAVAADGFLLTGFVIGAITVVAGLSILRLSLDQALQARRRTQSFLLRRSRAVLSEVGVLLGPSALARWAEQVSTEWDRSLIVHDQKVSLPALKDRYEGLQAEHSTGPADTQDLLLRTTQLWEDILAFSDAALENTQKSTQRLASSAAMYRKDYSLTTLSPHSTTGLDLFDLLQRLVIPRRRLTRRTGGR